MKKILFCLFFTLVLITSIFADGYYVGKGMSGKRLAIHEPEFKNINSNDTLYLQDLVSTLSTYFHDYAGFDMVDVQNQEKIKKLQAKSESNQYDYTTSLSAGKLQFAEYEGFVTVSKAGSVYSLSINITDLTTMKIIAPAIIKNISKITDVDTVGVRNLMMDIIPKIGVELTAMGRYSLSGNKNDNFTIDQEVNFAKQEEKSLQLSWDKLNSELKNLSKTDTDIDSVARKAQLEVDMQLAEKRLAMVQEKTLRLIEQQEKEFKEKIKASERSQEVNKRITSLSNDVENIAAEIRNKKFTNLSYSEQILVIEKNKKAYLELRNKIEEEIISLYSDANKEYNDRKIDVNDVSQYRKGELSNGIPMQSAKNIKIQKNTELYNSLMNEAKKNEEDLRNKTQVSNILNDIQEKEIVLSKPQIISSLEDISLLSIGDYDGKEKAWPCSVKIRNGGKDLITDSFQIYFNDLSKALGGTVYSVEEMEGKSKFEKYNSYLDDVETYDSLFRMGTPLVFLDAEVIVTPLGKDNPSGYSISVSKYVLKATTSSKIITTVRRSNLSSQFYSVPAYDLRTQEELTLVNAKKQAEIAQNNARIQQESQRRQAKNRREQLKTTAKNAIKNKSKRGYLYSAGLSAGCFSILFSYESPLSNISNKFFAAGDIALTFESENTNLFFDMGGRLGFVGFLPIGNYPGFFVSGGLGVRKHDELPEANLYILGEVGMDFGISKLCKFEIKYQIDYDEYSFLSNRYYVGLLVDLDNL